MTIHQYAMRIHIPTMERTAVPFGEIDAHQDGVTWHKCGCSPEHNGLDLQSALLVVNRWNYIAATTYSKVTHIYYLPTADGAV